ncbi:MAG TPA: nitroreductase/quinone reductase family protein [Candidatus Angelobacter sp.]|nr:nitroreductase/quinone reductase family protein [Candidatus Angelobacter sp.]
MRIDLTTIGARTGQPRTTELYAWPDGEALVIVGSKGGSARHPAWVHNLRATPQVTVKRGRSERPMLAREVTEADERERMWALVVEAFPLYATYQARTERRIPLFVLEPIAGS